MPGSRRVSSIAVLTLRSRAQHGVSKWWQRALGHPSRSCASRAPQDEDCSCCALLARATPAAAQTWPDKPIRLLVGFAAGGPTDIAARVVGDRLAEVLGKPVIVENVTGAAGNVATERVAKAAPDGYTLLAAASATIVTNPSLYAKLNFDPVKDFAPITQIVTTPNLLVVPNDLPVKSVAELVAYAKAQSGKLSFGSAGVGTSQHLAGELFRTMAGIDLQHVPYRGISATVPDLLAGRLTMVFGNISAMQPLAREGKARALAVTSPRRWPSVPELPTMIELGYKDFELERVVRPDGARRDAAADHR